MKNLVTIEHNQPFTTSIAIAEGTHNEHRVILQLLRKHEKRFNKYQRVAFEMRPFFTNGGQQVMRVALLDERQAYLLMTMLRNTERVLDFKEALVDSFMKAKSLLMTGQMGLLQAQAILYANKEQEKSNASMHGKGLADWKKKRDALDLAIQSVQKQMQPDLVNFEQALIAC